MNRLSLQWRITLSTAVILLICTVSLTFISLKSAGRSFNTLATDISPLTLITPAADTLPKSEILIPATNISSPKAMIALKKAEHHFSYSSTIFCILVTLVGTVITYFIAGYSLKPLRELNKSISNIDDENLSSRLETKNSKDELALLTSDFNKMLDRLEDAFSRQKQFVANAAHELKTPLATIKTGAEVLNTHDGSTISDFRDNNSQTIKTTDNMNKIIEDLILLVKSENNMPLSSEEIDIQALLDAIYDELFPKLKKKNITVEIDSEDIEIKNHFAFLYRALLNLVDNAVKYGRVNGNIYISAGKVQKDIIIRVKDDGIGIKEENIPYLFDPFYRVENSRSRKTGGSGLGLSIVKTTLKACGGSIDVNSVEHIGSEFIITLPQC